MYPYDIVFGMDLYDIFLALGVVAALVIARIYADKDHVSAKLFNFIILTGLASVILGYSSAVVTQAVYNWLGGEEFRISATTGATFLGGLLGGVSVFLLIYFCLGHFIFKRKENIAYFPRLLDFSAVAITCAHGFGRLGCLMAGCCHGAVTDAWYGIYHVALESKVVPIQLFEAVFLFALSATLAYLVSKRINGTMALYMLAYGIWRFIIENFRADDRGSTVVDFLTPSQLTSLVLIIGSVFVYVLTVKMSKKYTIPGKNNEK
ncbi:MAG: prolipoprotein diacylglyceryl transferase [Eubacteriales bacterium]